MRCGHQVDGGAGDGDALSQRETGTAAPHRVNMRTQREKNKGDGTQDEK